MTLDCCFRKPEKGSAAGLTLLELMAATAISGLVALAVLTSARLGLRAWEKGQSAVLHMRRVTNVEDILHFQLSNYLLRSMVVELPDRRQQMPFFFAEEQRLTFLTSYSARERGRGGIVVADYFARQQSDQSWSLWLDERPALDDAELARWVEGIIPAAEGMQPILRPFEPARAVLLWEGLSECRFQYRRESPTGGEWAPSWSLLSRAEMPSAVALQVRADEAGWKGLAPLPVYVRMGLEGIVR